MRRCFSSVLVGILCVAPSFAAQDHSAANDGAATKDESSAKSSTNTTDNAKSEAPKKSFSFADAPKPNPFAPPDNASSGDQAPGRVFPRWEAGGAYDYVNFIPGGPIRGFDNHGGSGEVTYNLYRWLGFTGELAGYRFHGTAPNPGVKGAWSSFAVGPRLNLRRFDRFIPFAELLLGEASVPGQVTGSTGQTAFAALAGGGIDVALTKNFVWRFAQLDYFMTRFSGPGVYKDHQDNFRAATGIVFRWGIPNPPPPAPKMPPTASCSASPSSVYEGSGDSVAIHVNASSPDNFPLTYTYTATGGSVDGTGPDARWNSSGAGIGSYSVTAKVDDGHGQNASCSADVRVEKKPEPPHHPPTISCSADRSTIQPGERVTITSNASSPDGLSLTYNYSASSGQVSGNGPTAQFDSTGLSPGSYSIRCGVTDSRGDKADSSTSVDLQQPPPPPQATKIGDCSYRMAASSRVDNVCKRVLDDVAMRLKNEPNAKLVVVGYADPHEPAAAKLAAKRADLVKAYLGEKGIDASRISTRTGEASKEKGQEKANRRIETIFVPEGATY